jgi:hypothetical protein
VKTRFQQAFAFSNATLCRYALDPVYALPVEVVQRLGLYD